MSQNTEYYCEITKQTFKQKSHIDKHLKTKLFKQALRIKELELEKLTEEELIDKYGDNDIKKILDELSSQKIKHEYELIKKKKDGSIYFKLNEDDKKLKEDEQSFKNDFKNKLKKWHNMLSGCGVTGDPAFDDIINILSICFLETRISDTGKYDFKNIDKYTGQIKQKKIKKYLEVFNIDYIKNNTKSLTKSSDNNDGKSIFSKIGFILSNHPLTKRIFQEGFINCNKDNILSDLISEIYDYSKQKNIFQYQDLVGIAYEFWLNDYQGNSGKELGNYFTERDLMLMTFNLIDNGDIIKYINNESVIGDEFCGTFGYPLFMKQYLKKFGIEIKDKNIYGIELGERHSRLSIINAMFSIDDFTNIKRGDSFITNVSEHLDLSIHNVPFGKRISYKNTKEHYEDYRESKPELPKFEDIVPVDIEKCDATTASQMVIYKTKHIGLCIIKDGQETSGSGKFIKYRKYFCDTCNIKKILKIPGGIFSSTGTKTVCLYFVKGEQTKDIEFMELNKDCDTITRLVKVNYNDLKHNDYSWDPNTYMIDEEFAKMMVKSNCEFEKLSNIFKIKGGKYNSSDMDNNGNNPFYRCTAINPQGTHSDYNNDYDEYLLLISAGGSKNNLVGDNVGLGKCYYLNGKSSTMSGIFTLLSKININYKYYYHYFNINRLYTNKLANFTTNLGKISIKNLDNLLIPLPSKEIQEKCVQQLDLLNIRKQRLEEDNDMINKKIKYYFENQIKKNLDNIEVKKMSEICKFENGTQLDTKNIIKGRYPVYGGGKKIVGYHNNFNRYGNDTIVCGTGIYCGYVQYNNNNFWASQCFTIKSKSDTLKNKFFFYFIKNNLENIFMKSKKGGAQPYIRATQFLDTQIVIPSKEKQDIIVEYLDNIEKVKHSNNEQIEKIKELMKSILEQSYS